MGDVKVCVVGGGVVGCSTAYFLTQMGCQVRNLFQFQCHLSTFQMDVLVVQFFFQFLMW